MCILHSPLGWSYLKWLYKQPLHRMCLIGDSIPIVNRLTPLTIRCQLSNVRITVSALKGHNIILETLRMLNCWCLSLVVD